MGQVGVVVPTCRGYSIPEQTIDVSWYIVHDQEMRKIDNPAHADVHHIVAPYPEFYGSKNSSIRSAGVREAYLEGCDYILTVDDDCFIPLDWAERHVEQLSKSMPIHKNTMGEYARARGLPYGAVSSPVVVTHGLWDGVPDLDGANQTVNGVKFVRHDDRFERIEPLFPMSGMNLGFRRCMARYMYWAPQGEGFGYDRFEDIWMGLVAETVAKTLGFTMVSGGACVYHTRASDSITNLTKEGPGYLMNEWLWRAMSESDIYFHPAMSPVESILEHLLAFDIKDPCPDIDYISLWLSNAIDFEKMEDDFDFAV